MMPRRRHALPMSIAGVSIHLVVREGDFTSRVLERFVRQRPPVWERLLPGLGAATLREGWRVSVSCGGLRGHADLRTGRIESPPSMRVLDLLVRAVVYAGLLARGGLLLHAAAIERNGGVLVAFGASRAGKSTLAQGLGGRVLADDFVAMDRNGGGWRVWPTPWWRGEGPPASLQQLIWLVRGEPPSVRQSRGAALCAALWREAGRFVPGNDLDARTLESCVDLARLGALRVAAPEGRVVETVRNAA